MQSIYPGFMRYASYAAIMLLSLTFDGCTDHQLPPPPPADTPTGDFSDDIKKNISQDNLDKIRELGVNVCEGKTVPNLEGIFFQSPSILTKTTVPDDVPIGTRFADYRYRIKNQDGTKLIAEVDLKGIINGQVRDEANGKTAFLSGTGNCFTLFVIIEGTITDSGSRYRALDVYSGEKTAQGVRNFQNAFLMLNDYGDPNGDLIPVNSGRAINDNDGFSETQSSFRLAAPTGNEELHPKAYFKQ